MIFFFMKARRFVGSCPLPVTNGKHLKANHRVMGGKKMKSRLSPLLDKNHGD